MNKFELEVAKNKQNYVISNFEEVKKIIENGIKKYKDKVYIDSVEAKEDKEVLETVKKQIEATLKEIKKPYVDVEKQLGELLDLVKVPLSNIRKYEKDIKQNILKQKILDYAKEALSDIGDFGDKILNNKNFFEDQWLLTSKFTEKKWKEAINEKVASISRDIESINRIAQENKTPILAVYFETLSMSSVKNFINNVNDSNDININQMEDVDKVVGYKTIKVYGTSSQISQLYDELDLIGLDYEEIEDGMPREQEELLQPDFDSFVAFDIEHSGTYGAKYGDGPAEITEIGAVKVQDGEIIDTFYMLANPGRKITKRNEVLTRITNEMVKDKPPVSEVIKAFKEFCGDDILVGHNIKNVDLPYISLAGKRNGIAFENKFFDTCTYARKFKKEKNWEDVRLEHLANYFNIEDPGHHRADNDAKVNVDVYFKLKDLMK